MIINLIWEPSVTNATNLNPGFQTDVAAVASYLSGRFTDDITFNLHVGYGDVGAGSQQLTSGTLGASNWYGHTYTYEQLRTALTQHLTTSDDFTAVSTLPISDPFPGDHEIWVADPLAAALGLKSPDGPIDVYVGFSNSVSWDYTRADGITAGEFDFIGSVAHEITEAMGRLLGAGQTGAGGNTSLPDYHPLDLFHYSAGERSFTPGGYFAISPTRPLAEFASLPTSDFVDWAASAGNDAFLDMSFTGVYNDITPRDLRLMDVIGFKGYPDDYGQDVNFAWHVSPGVPEHGSIELLHDADWFRVQLNADVRYVIRLSGADGGGGTLADPFLAIWDSSSNFVAQDNDSGPGHDALLSFTPTQSGYYYVAASAYFGAGTGDYTLRVTPRPDVVSENVPDRALAHLPTSLGGAHDLPVGPGAHGTDLTLVEANQQVQTVGAIGVPPDWMLFG